MSFYADRNRQRVAGIGTLMAERDASRREVQRADAAALEILQVLAKRRLAQNDWEPSPSLAGKLAQIATLI